MTCPLANHVTLAYSTVIFKHSVNPPFQLEFFKIFTYQKKVKVCKVKTENSYLKSLAVML